MATFRKFDCFIADVANGVHNLSTAQLMVALSAVSPSASNSTLSNITQISYANLSSGRGLTVSSSSQSGGVYSLVLADKDLVCSGALPSFRYFVVYNSTAATEPLIFWTDYGSTVSLTAGDVITIDFASSVLTIQ